MRSDIEVQAEILALKGQLTRVRRFTFFGDDNQAAINAQIRTLEEGLDENDIYEYFGDPDGMEVVYEEQAALDAYNWLWETDDELEAPSVGWETLCEEA